MRNPAQRNGEFVMLDKATVRDIAEKYAEEVKKVLQPTAIVLFGSYVNGKPHE